MSLKSRIERVRELVPPQTVDLASIRSSVTRVVERSASTASSTSVVACAQSARVGASPSMSETYCGRGEHCQDGAKGIHARRTPFSRSPA